MEHANSTVVTLLIQKLPANQHWAGGLTLGAVARLLQQRKLSGVVKQTMNRTRKIALLSAVAGCLVLVLIIGVMAYRSYRRQTVSQTDTNRNVNGNLSG